jgi:hypothetical protein
LLWGPCPEVAAQVSDVIGCIINPTLRITGDLAGALGIYVFSITPGGNGVVAKVHHHWVTDAGDTIYLEDAIATAFQVGAFSGVYAVAGNSYTVNIIGGTGRFAGATGQFRFPCPGDSAQLEAQPALTSRQTNSTHCWLCLAAEPLQMPGRESAWLGLLRQEETEHVDVEALTWGL